MAASSLAGGTSIVYVSTLLYVESRQAGRKYAAMLCSGGGGGGVWGGFKCEDETTL